jgi:hypothetical protein
MSQDDVSVQVTVLPAPRLNLQSAVPEQVATEFAPALSSHFEEALQAMWLPSPPLPLHSAVSPQVTDVADVDEALHLDPVSQVMLQGEAPQLALQSDPAVQVQAAATHIHPAPVHVGAELPPPPHASTVHAANASAQIRVRTPIISICLSSRPCPSP